ncbi:MAG: S9 family peptidase [Cyclobacteriaceae bacterium]
MKTRVLLLASVMITIYTQAQNVMTPERLWQLGRVSSLGVTPDGQQVVYRVSTPLVAENTNQAKMFTVFLTGGSPKEITSAEGLLKDKNISPDGKYRISVRDVKIQKVFGKEFYPALQKSNAHIYESLNYRHWDTWEDGAYSHLFVQPANSNNAGDARDILEGEPFDCPQKPFGGDEDYTWSPDSRFVVYVTKRKSGTAYTVSTNTDLYAYEVATGKTTNLTEGLIGYDTHPVYSEQGTLAWQSMKRDGYEADKNDILVKNGTAVINLTQDWDGTVNTFVWSQDGKKIYFTAPTDGTIQLFEVENPGVIRNKPVIKQITKGEFDVTGIAGQSVNDLVVSRTDMNHAVELYRVNVSTGAFTQLTRVNDDAYQKLSLSKVEKRYVRTTDGKQLLVWVIYPPGFDASKKYPTLLYCQGGPQSSLTQFYSFRWNFQLMAANGYIVVAPARRGMPVFGFAWNEKISKDWGGQVMDDYLSAIDEVSKERFVDKTRLGCVGASYGGYSVFYLAGIHNKRFKTFISHDGVFNMKSMYGTTEELWFVNWDMGGPYWENENADAQKTYQKFDPSLMVEKWNTPIMIVHGGKDFRVPLGQSLEAFQAAQLRGIKSKLVYFPEENHWVLSAQNALVWQHEFFKWLEETL